MRLKLRRVIITGGSSGIGRAMCKVFAREGAKVVVADIDNEGSKETVDLIQSSGGYATAINTDVSSLESVQHLVHSSVDQLGGIDIVVNNAAAFVLGKVEDVGSKDWGKVFGVNVIGAANLVKLSLPYLKKSSSSNIVNIASISSYIAQPAYVPYNASKGALLQLTKCLAMDLAEFNIRVNAICPGYIYTPATDRYIASTGYSVDKEEFLKERAGEILLKRVGTSEEVANAALFLASDEASFITGAHLVVDGGTTI